MKPNDAHGMLPTSDRPFRVLILAGSNRPRRWPLGWLIGGVLFGSLFFLIEDEGVGPAMGLVGKNTEYLAEADLRGLVAHVAFGVTAAAVARVFGVGKVARRIRA